jgi:oxalate decarboxylase
MFIIIFSFNVIALYFSSKSIREPYWRPKAAEIGFVVNGHARISILLPNDDRQLHTCSLQTDYVFFTPPGYPHYIENIGDEDLKIFMFFDQSNADDIGYKGGFLAYSREVLSATFQCDSKQLPTVIFNRQNSIVKRVNPVDS